MSREGRRLVETAVRKADATREAKLAPLVQLNVHITPEERALVDRLANDLATSNRAVVVLALQVLDAALKEREP